MNFKHGQYGTKEYKAWFAMRRRCGGTASSSRYYTNIAVCERWESFENFLADMGPRPDGMSLDRIDNAGPYAPENCRWADHGQQMRNTRNNVMLTCDGKTMCVAEWARFLGIPKMRIHKRLSLGWPVERVLSKEMFHKGEGKRLRRVLTTADQA
jgi:hypothetical protein